jgi:lipase chaperone LimK
LPTNTGVKSENREYPSRLLTVATVTIPEQLPASLEGTDVPSGWDKTDATGSLVPTPELRQLFEHYLAALGEETLAQLVARIEMTLATLEEPARSEAIEILGAYLDYKLELGELEAASGEVASLDPDAMAQQLSRIRSLRRQWLDADTAAAFFAMEEAVDNFQLAQMRIRANETLSDEARAAQLQEAEQALPDPIREARQQTRKFSDYQQMRQELSDDPEALQAWRKNAFGEAAAGRLAQVEEQQQAWDQNWEAYQQEKAELEKLGLEGPEREAALLRLREQFFDGPEMVRAEALDSIQ